MKQMYFWNSLAFSMIQPMLVISVSSTFPKTSLYDRNFLVHILLKTSLKETKNNLTSTKNECSCMVARMFFGIALLWD